MITALSTQHNKHVSFVYLAACCVLVIAAGIIGIADNAPGILCAFGATVAAVLTFVHPWRTAKQFVILLFGAALCFVIFAVLHNVLHGVAGNVENVQILSNVLEGLGVVAFLLALLVCPPAFVVGVVGSLVMLCRKHD